MTELEVQLTADLKNLKKQLRIAEGKLKKFGAEGAKANEKLGDSFGKTKKGAANATPTLLEFNRVIQDAPFGIQGVANNLTQLTQNFGYLKQQTGSTGGALKALLAGFTGPAGILFVVSAATSLLVTYGDKLFNAASLTGDLAKATKDYIGSAKAEISELQALVEIAKNDEKSRELREKAIARINDKYGDLLGNLTTESIKTDAVTESINKLNQALLNEAKLRGVRSVIEEKYGALAEQIAKKEEAFRSGASAQLREQNKLLNERKKALEQVIPTVEKASKTDSNAIKALESLRAEYDEITKKLGASGQLERRENAIAEFIKADSKEVEGEIARLQEILKPLLEFDILSGLNDPKDKSKKKKLLTKEQIDELVNAQELEDAANEAVENLIFMNKVFVETGAALKETANDGLEDGVWESFFRIQQLEEAEANMKKRLEAIQKGLSDILTDLPANLITNISEALGAALGAGDNALKAVSASLLSTLGGVLVDLGKLAISVGVGIASVKKALKTLNPVVAIAAGAGLIALGSAFRAGASNIAKGGGASNIGGQGSSTSSGFQGSTVSSFSGGGFNGRVVFEISGNKLIGVMNNTLSGNKRLGGNLSIG